MSFFPIIQYGRVTLADLLGHEETDPAKVDSVGLDLLMSGYQKVPILVGEVEIDGRTIRIILDGHHRAEALRTRCLAKYAAACVVPYRGFAVRLEAWRQGETIKKQDVIEAALGRPMPAKSTRHTLHAKIAFPPVRISTLIGTPKR